MSNRAILLLMGIVLAYFAIYFGDAVYANRMADSALPEGAQVGWYAGSIIIGSALAVGGFIVWTNALEYTLSGQQRTSPDVNTFCAVTSLVCLACVFGIAAGPFSNYGAYPWYWTSHWDWLVVFALVPIVFEARNVLSEAITARRERKEKRGGNVFPIRRNIN